MYNSQTFIFYAFLYYIIANFSLMLRCFMQLYVLKKPVTKTDFVIPLIWPVLLWLIPMGIIKDIRALLCLRRNLINKT